MYFQGLGYVAGSKFQTSDLILRHKPMLEIISLYQKFLPLNPINLSIRLNYQILNTLQRYIVSHYTQLSAPGLIVLV